MAVGKGSIMRASNAVKEKERETAGQIEGQTVVQAAPKQEVMWAPTSKLLFSSKDSQMAEMTEREQTALQASLKKYGFLLPVLVWKREMAGKEELVILDGIKRVKAANIMGIKEIPIIVSFVKTQAEAEKVRKELNAFAGTQTQHTAVHTVDAGISSQIPVYLL